MDPHTIVDGANKSGKIYNMIRRMIHGAMRSSMDELLREPLQGIRGDIGKLQGDMGEVRREMRENFRDVRSDIRELKEGQRHLASQISGLASRVDDLGRQQGHLVEKVAELRADVTILTGK